MESPTPATSFDLAAWRGAAQKFMAEDPFTLAASIAFYSALSFAPIVAISFWLSSRFSPGLEGRLVAELGNLFGAAVRDVAVVIAQNNHASPLALTPAAVVSGGVLLFSATTAFAQLQNAINLIFDAPVHGRNMVRTWLRRRLLSLGMLATIGFLLIVTLVLSTLVSVLLHGDGVWWLIVNEAVTVAIFSAAFATLFRFVPDSGADWIHALAGGCVTAILFELGKWLLGLWLAEVAFASAYGAGNAVVSLLLWVYYSALIVLVGAAFTGVIARRQEQKVALGTLPD